MKPLACGIALCLLAGCSTLLPTADQVPDETGYGSTIYGDDATVSIVYVGKDASRPTFRVTIVNHSEDTLFLEPHLIRYFASSSPFVSVRDAPDDWMALSARNSKLPLTMQFAVDSKSAIEDSEQRLTFSSNYRVILPYETDAVLAYLHPEALLKYYRLVIVVAGDFYVFDFVRDAQDGLVEALLVGLP